MLLPGHPTRSRLSGLYVTGRVGCIGSGGASGLHKMVYGRKGGTVGAQRVSMCGGGGGIRRERQEVVCSNCGATPHGSISENFRW